LKSPLARSVNLEGGILRLKALSLLGTYNLRLGVIKELRPDMVATCEGTYGRGAGGGVDMARCESYEGHPFVVEAAVALGGKDVKPVWE
jgi:DNA topoisomerase VI subunit B